MDEPDLLEVNLRGLRGKVVLRHADRPDGVDDRRTLWELWRRRPYESTLFDRPGSLLDIGANVGLLPVWLAHEKKSPTRYVGVEADPDSARVLRRQVANLKFDAPPVVIEAAAGDRIGVARFDTSGDSMFHGVSDTGGVEVPMKPVADLMDEAGLERADVMKLDIEGGEAAVIPDAARWAHRVDAIVCELHNDLDARWLDRHLRPLGFRTFDFGTLVREGHAAVNAARFADLPAAARARALP